MEFKSGDLVSKPVKIKEAVLQGDTMAPMLASVDMDDLAKDWEHVVGDAAYKYRNSLPIPSLGLMDDLIMISTAGRQTTKANSLVNVVSSSKGLQFSESKCNSMLVKNPKLDCLHNKVKLDKWEHDRVNGMLHEKYVGKVPIKESDSFKYMGTVVQNDAGNQLTLADKAKKALISTQKIISKINHLCPGRFLFEVVSVLRESVFLGSLLYGVEVLSNWKSENTKLLQQLDSRFLKQALDLPPHTPDCLLLLELGIEPIETKLMSKRMLFLKYLVDHPEDLAHSILRLQIKTPLKGDWWTQAKSDLKDLGLTSNLDEIKALSKEAWKKTVKTKAKILALVILNLKKNKLKSKGKKIGHSDLRIRAYLLPEAGLSKEQMATCLKMRMDMLDLPKCLPFKYKYRRNCRFGCSEEEDVFHMMSCSKDSIDKTIDATVIEKLFSNTIPLKSNENLLNLIKIIKSKTLSYNEEMHKECIQRKAHLNE